LHKLSQADSDLTHSTNCVAGTVNAVEKERAILERLERIDGLRRQDAPAEMLLEEVRALLCEAEDWAREEDVPDRAAKAIERSREALDGVFAAPRG
jgi:hypothetical protein